VDNIRVRKRTFKIIHLVRHVNHFENMLSDTITYIILDLHYFGHQDVGVSFEGSLKMFLDLDHERLDIFWILRKSPSASRIDGIAHYHK
jgi:hypothetical protein